MIAVVLAAVVVFGWLLCGFGGMLFCGAAWVGYDEAREEQKVPVDELHRLRRPWSPGVILAGGLVSLIYWVVQWESVWASTLTPEERVRFAQAITEQNVIRGIYWG